MRRGVSFGLALATSVLLAACFLLPGKFASTLDVRRDRTFHFTYKGEIVVVTPPGTGSRFAPEVDDPTRPCVGPRQPTPGDTAALPPLVTAPSMRPPGFGPHPCSPDERAKRTADIARRNADGAQRQKREAEQIAQIVGMDPNDQTSMRAYATGLAKQAGWRSVVYRGNGVFDVDYAVTGRLDRDFVFPVLPRVTIIVPFVVIRTRADGAVLVGAPGYRANPGQALMSGFNSGRSEAVEMASRPQGSFVITTDAAPLTNNTDDGPVQDGKRTRLTWTTTTASDKAPEALIPLGR